MPAYTALVLDKASRELLTRLVPPCHAKVFADHVTLQVEPASPIAEEFKGACRVVGVRSDSKGQAVDVVLDANCERLCAGHTPHITISCEGKTPPAYSNEMEAISTSIGFGLVLTGIVKTVLPKD